MVGRTADPGWSGQLSELSVSLVVKQMIATHRRDKQVIPPIVVVVANGHAHTVATQLEAGTGRDIGEATFAVVVIQRHRGRLSALRNVPGPPGRVDEEQIGRAVVVEVKESNPATHGFREQFVAVSAIIVDKGYPGFFGNVGELRHGNIAEG